MDNFGDTIVATCTPTKYFAISTPTRVWMARWYMHRMHLYSVAKTRSWQVPPRNQNDQNFKPDILKNESSFLWGPSYGTLWKNVFASWTLSSYPSISKYTTTARFFLWFSYTQSNIKQHQVHLCNRPHHIFLVFGDSEDFSFAQCNI